MLLPLPPRDAFERVVAAIHQRQRSWLACDAECVLALLVLSPLSKGARLDNLAVVLNA